jgi:hypothetical protein
VGQHEPAIERLPKSGRATLMLYSRRFTIEETFRDTLSVEGSTR